jgi:hypothetical protein
MCLLTYYCYLQPKKIAVYELLEISDDQLTADQLFTKKKVFGQVGEKGEN